MVVSTHAHHDLRRCAARAQHNKRTHTGAAGGGAPRDSRPCAQAGECTTARRAAAVCGYFCAGAADYLYRGVACTGTRLFSISLRRLNVRET